MAVLTKTQLDALFQPGTILTPKNILDLIDSVRLKTEEAPATGVEVYGAQAIRNYATVGTVPDDGVITLPQLVSSVDAVFELFMYLTSDYSSRAAGPTSQSDVRYRTQLRAQIIKLCDSLYLRQDGATISGAKTFFNQITANAGIAVGGTGLTRINLGSVNIGGSESGEVFNNIYARNFDGGTGNTAKFKGNLDGDLSKDIPEGETDTNIEVNRNLNLASGKQLIGNVNGALYPIIYTNELQLDNSFQVYFSREDKGDKYNGGSVYRIEMTVVSQEPLSPLSDRFIYFSGRLNVTSLAIFFTGFSSSWYGSDVSIDGSSYVQKKLVDNSTNTGESILGSSRTGSQFVGGDLNIEITPIVPEERYVLNQLLFIASPSVNPIDRYTP